jgi:hypothetical protein
MVSWGGQFNVRSIGSPSAFNVTVSTYSLRLSAPAYFLINFMQIFAFSLASNVNRLLAQPCTQSSSLSPSTTCARCTSGSAAGSSRQHGDVALLSADELQGLQQDAEKEATEEHLELVREKAKKIFKEKHRRRLLVKSDPNEGERDIFLDLAPRQLELLFDEVLEVAEDAAHQR